jgi:protoheme IX farnesyltransferase
LYKTEDYANAKIPMLPVVSGIKITKINIFVYSVILFFISIAPYFFGFFGLTYFISSLLLGSYYVYLCYRLLTDENDVKKIAKKIFVYSILYLFLIFTIILIDNIL